jgi:hypothetical protein
VLAMQTSAITFPVFLSERNGKMQAYHQLHTARHRIVLAFQVRKQGSQACETVLQICETPKQACKTVSKFREMKENTRESL